MWALGGGGGGGGGSDSPIILPLISPGMSVFALKFTLVKPMLVNELQYGDTLLSVREDLEPDSRVHR